MRVHKLSHYSRQDITCNTNDSMPSMHPSWVMTLIVIPTPWYYPFLSILRYSYMSFAFFHSNEIFMFCKFIYNILSYILSCSSWNIIDNSWANIHYQIKVIKHSTFACFTIIGINLECSMHSSFKAFSCSFQGLSSWIGACVSYNC